MNPRARDLLDLLFNDERLDTVRKQQGLLDFQCLIELFLLNISLFTDTRSSTIYLSSLLV